MSLTGCGVFDIKLCNAGHDITVYLWFISIQNFTFYPKTEIILLEITGRWKRWPCDYSVWKSLLGGFNRGLSVCLQRLIG